MLNSFRFLIATFLMISFSPALLASAADTPDSIAGTTKVFAEDIPGLLEKHEDLVIVDARIDKDKKGGYIEGAVSLPDIKTTEQSLAKLVPSKSTPVLFYCNGVKCGRSVKSSKNAVKWGYSKVYWFRGGWEEWVAKGMPITK